MCCHSLKRLLFSDVCVFVCTHMCAGTPGARKRMLELLEVALQLRGSHLRWIPETKLRPPGRAVNAPNHGAVSPALGWFACLFVFNLTKYLLKSLKRKAVFYTHLHIYCLWYSNPDFIYFSTRYNFLLV